VTTMPEVGQESRMQSGKIHRFWRSWIRAVPGALLVGLVTFICYGLGLNLTATGFLYLIIVVLQSLLGDFISSAIVSIIADVCLNFFFVPPIFSFRVSDSSDIWALIAFLMTGLVITRLMTQVRHEAETSELQRHEMKLLYELTRRLLALDPDDLLMTRAVGLFRDVFRIQAVCLYDGANTELYSDGESPHGLAERTRAAYISRRDADDGVSGVCIRCLQAAGQTMGAIGFDGLRDAELTSAPLTALATAMLERERVFSDASHAAAAAQAEVFRGAILDALAHEFKTPLATIVTAAGGLRATSGLRPEQLELAETAEMEASKLGRLTSRLLRIARLDKEEVKPQLELTDIVELVALLADEYAKRWADRKISLTRDVISAEVLADAELVRLAMLQLLDNACKYSRSGSTIKICIDSQPDFVAVRVWNSGSPIAANERARIFERFYRGTEARQVAPGSGLGLYVARKIVQAHGGNLDLETGVLEGGEEPYSEGTSFRLTIPIAKGDSDHVGDIV
jgi:two-component system, OmpR family, sensor histidine kinase KdpD